MQIIQALLQLIGAGAILFALAIVFVALRLFVIKVQYRMQSSEIEAEKRNLTRGIL